MSQSDRFTNRALRRGRALASALVAVTALEAPALATPAVVNLSWNACTSPVDLGLASGPVRTLVVTEQGLSGPVLGIQFTIQASSTYSGLGDAWRFDGGGCNAANWQVLQQAGGPGCPVLHGAGQPLFFAAYEYVPQSSLVAVGRIRFAEGFNPAATPSSGLLTVATIVFDQSASALGPTTPDSCGCLSRAVCFSLQQASYLDAQSNEISFVTAQDHLTWNDPQGIRTLCGFATDPFARAGSYPDTSCVAQVPVPARAASWGSVKHIYRAPAR